MKITVGKINLNQRNIENNDLDTKKKNNEIKSNSPSKENNEDINIKKDSNKVSQKKMKF